MKGHPKLKVYTAEGEYVASCHYLMHAAAVVSLCPGGTVRWDHAKKNTLWTEGSDGFASESFDSAVSVMQANFDVVKERILNRPKRLGQS